MKYSWSKIVRGESDSIEAVPADAIIIAIDGKRVAGKCHECSKYVFYTDSHYIIGAGIYCEDCYVSLSKKVGNGKDN